MGRSSRSTRLTAPGLPWHPPQQSRGTADRRPGVALQCRTRGHVPARQQPGSRAWTFSHGFCEITPGSTPTRLNAGLQPFVPFARIRGCSTPPSTTCCRVSSRLRLGAPISISTSRTTSPRSPMSQSPRLTVSRRSSPRSRTQPGAERCRPIIRGDNAYLNGSGALATQVRTAWLAAGRTLDRATR